MTKIISLLVIYIDWMLLKIYLCCLGAGLILISVEYYLKHPAKIFLPCVFLGLGIIFSINLRFNFHNRMF